jgi:hypothetical protein
LRVALVTCAALPDLTRDDQLLRAALEARGAAVAPRIWDHEVSWGDFDTVVLRSCWDYHRRLPEFLDWLFRMEALGVRLWNPAALVRANTRKSYLREWEAAGVRIAPTAWVEKGSQVLLSEILAAHAWPEAVVKPAVSASAYGTFRASIPVSAPSEAEFRRLLGEGDVLVQPFLREVVDSGEWSFVYLGGAFSHAVLKRARAGEFRIQEEFGGLASPEAPGASLLEAAHQVAARIPEPWLYARIDAIEQGGELLLMELELIEPELYLRWGEGADVRLATLILA